jgi:hypothetical protein
MSQPLIETLSALLTPTVAVVTVLIAYRQYRVERLMAKHALYSRRLESYVSAITYSKMLALQGKLDQETDERFRAVVAEAPFILGKDAVQLLQDIFQRGIEITVNDSLIDHYPLDQAQYFTLTIRDHQQWLLHVESRLFTVFKPYLSLVEGGHRT